MKSFVAKGQGITFRANKDKRCWLLTNLLSIILKWLHGPQSQREFWHINFRVTIKRLKIKSLGKYLLFAPKQSTLLFVWYLTGAWEVIKRIPGWPYMTETNYIAINCIFGRKWIKATFFFSENSWPVRIVNRDINEPKCHSWHIFNAAARLFTFLAFPCAITRDVTCPLRASHQLHECGLAHVRTSSNRRGKVQFIVSPSYLIIVWINLRTSDQTY